MWSSILVAVCSVLLVLVFWLIEKRCRFRSLDQLPGPKGWPIFGSALEMGNNPTDFLRVLKKFLDTYGRVCHFWIIWRPYIFLSDPKWIEFLLTSTTHMDKTIDYDFLINWLGNGLLIAKKPHWKEHRKIITPAFHFKILENSIEVFHNNTEALLQSLSKVANGDVVDIYPHISRYSLDVIAEAAMGTKLNSQNSTSKTIGDYLQSIRDECQILLRRSFSSWKRSDILFKFSQDYQLEKKALKNLHSFTNKVIVERREVLKNDREGETRKEDEIGIKKRTAFLDMLLEATKNGLPLTDKEIRDEVDTFMFAGHDTASSAIGFTLFELSLNPDVQDKVLTEVLEVLGKERRQITMKDLTEMKYLELVIKEGMRKFPPVPFYGRELREDAYFDGVFLPKGLNIEVFSFQVHRDPEFYPEPDKFIPERFLPENMAEKSVFMYVPFSAGSRNCIGQKFAMLEMKVALANIIRDFELSPAGDEYEPILSGEAVLKSVNGINVRLRKRT